MDTFGKTLTGAVAGIGAITILPVAGVVGSISLLGAAVAGTIGACTGANWDDVEEIIDYACMDEPEEDPKQRSQAFEDLVNSEAYQNWLNNLRYNSDSKGGRSATVQ